MAYNFTDDPNQFGGYGSIEDEQADAVIQEMEQEAVEQELDDQLSEVEKRLALASCYRLLLNDHLFGTMTPEAVQVEREIRAFIRERLEILVGLKQEQAPAKDVFTETEVAALKTIAAKVLKKPELVQDTPKPAPKAEPTLKKVDPTPSQPKVQPTVKKAAPAKQAVKKVAHAPQAKPTSAPAKPPEPKKPVQTGRIRKQYKEVTTPDGRTVKIDVTPQGTAPDARPHPTPMGGQATQISQMQAQQHAMEATKDPIVGMLSQKLVTAGE